MPVRIRDLQDPAREISVIVDATIALAPVGHKVTIKPMVRHGVLRHRFAELFNVAHFAHSLISWVALLEAPEEEASTYQSSKTHNTNDHTRSDGSSIRPVLLT